MSFLIEDQEIKKEYDTYVAKNKKFIEVSNQIIKSIDNPSVMEVGSIHGFNTLTWSHAYPSKKFVLFSLYMVPLTPLGFAAQQWECVVFKHGPTYAMGL